MKKSIVTLALGAILIAGPAVAADVVEKTTSTTFRGTVTEVNPTASTIILKSETATAPSTYAYTKQTTLVDPAGQIVTWDAIRDTPVTVYYTTEGDRMVATKVVTTKPVAELRKETTTTTERRISD
jgi:hypothetical protein